jgi:WD40-like Beta Propeller Repeat
MVAALLIALVLLIAVPPAAEATFPGKNGDLLVTDQYRPHSRDYENSLWRINRGGEVAWTTICAGWPDDRAPMPMCFWAGPPGAAPDGSAIAFASDDMLGEYPQYYGRAGIRVLSLATGAWREVPLPGLDLAQTPVRWTPEGGFMVLTGDHRVVRLLRDGSNPQPLLSHVQWFDVSSGGRVVFLQHRALRLLDSDGSSVILRGRGFSRPSWSPHGKWVAFARNGWVYSVRVDDGRVKRLARGTSPTWSPDGKWIAFFRTRSFATVDSQPGKLLFVRNWHNGRIRQVSSQVMSSVDGYDNATGGIDWLPAR